MQAPSPVFIMDDFHNGCEGSDDHLETAAQPDVLAHVGFQIFVSAITRIYPSTSHGSCSIFVWIVVLVS